MVRPAAFCAEGPFYCSTFCTGKRNQHQHPVFTGIAHSWLYQRPLRGPQEGRGCRSQVEEAVIVACYGEAPRPGQISTWPALSASVGYD